MIVSAFTREEIDALKRQFEINQHNVREGYHNREDTKIRWFVYVDWGEVKTRLDEHFPGEWETTEPKITYGTSSVTASVSLGIRGVWRGHNGAADGITADDAKGAATDAYRRAASMWGIAAYIYDMDFEIWTESYPKGNWDKMRERQNEARQKFADWYNRKFGGKSEAPPQQRQPAQTNDKPLAIVSQTFRVLSMQTREKEDGSPYYQMMTGSELVFAFSRAVFRAAGFKDEETDNWKKPGFILKFNKPFDVTAIRKEAKDGQLYWHAVTAEELKKMQEAA